MNERLAALNSWLSDEVGLLGYTIEAVSGDASFRRYFRVTGAATEKWVAMDAPPDREDCRPLSKWRAS